ncbi:hypothetical protein [Nevskia soli]|uniref:hypothetical protein n=1 Tax=Nevskia soli TaxID=418856 RepID=UPI0015D7D79D|nr:hypothetical protein [Nevskia soli]
MKELRRALSSLARDVPEPPDLEASLLAEFDRASRPRGFRLHLWIPALAALLVIAAVLLYRPAPPPRIASAPFLEIPYTAPLAPYERTRIVRMEVPVAALIAAGFDVRAPDTGAAVEADVLFGQDGRAHAFRVLSSDVLITN